MQDYEKNLFLALCLGAQLTGRESRTELNTFVEELNAAAVGQPVNFAQEDFADWLELYPASGANRQEASVRMWRTIVEAGYSLADIPMILRRQAFGGSLDIQTRLGRRPLHIRLVRRLVSLAGTLTSFIVIGAIIWVVWKLLLN